MTLPKGVQAGPGKDPCSFSQCYAAVTCCHRCYAHFTREVTDAAVLAAFLVVVLDWGVQGIGAQKRKGVKGDDVPWKQSASEQER